jgi:hypothetical protein
MNLKSLLGAFLAASLPLACLGVMPVDPYAGVRKAGSFAMGGVGEAGTMSAGERTLRQILKEPDAAARLEAMLTTATPAGQLYILLGLRSRDRAAYERVLEKLCSVDAKVETARGCMLSQENFRDLVKEIERGQYDAQLAQDWPERAR